MKDSLTYITDAASRLLRSGRTLALFFLVYLGLLAMLTLFILTREASIRDLLVTLVTTIAVPALFFLLQAMSVTYSDIAGTREVIRESIAILRKLIVVTIPFILVGLASYVILDKIDARFSPSLHDNTLTTLSREGEAWPRVVISTIRLVLFGVVFPLASIHAWIAVRRQGVGLVFNTIKPILLNAFSLQSVRTYVIGFGLFGILPYALIIVRTPSERAWLEISMLGLRLIVALALILIGWVITVGAIQRGATAPGMSNE